MEMAEVQKNIKSQSPVLTDRNIGEGRQPVFMGGRLAVDEKNFLTYL
jgi:hypothetical protein